MTTPTINLNRGGGALFVVGLVWVPISYFAISATGAIVAGIVASIGLVISALADTQTPANRRPQRNEMALSAEDLEDNRNE